MIIIKPKYGEKAYEEASIIFKDMYEAVTGRTLPISTDDDGKSDLVVIGSDAVNKYLETKMLSGEVENLGIRYGTDDYCIRSVSDSGRQVLILAGGRGRSTIYAVYDFFERRADCHYFWDGDIIPKSDTISIDNLDINESPRFEYRGLRYFAHRGLKRFQAEHWSFEDWKREIDWMLKKRFNFFMLRIGMDDLWQRVFPDEIPYPDPQEVHDEKYGFDDRSVFWPLEYRGKLREKIMRYALNRDLMHPEDCGTITHWYSPTPPEVFENENLTPVLMNQTTEGYSGRDTLVWDVTDQKSMENYMKLTEGYVNEFNPKCNLFHTIGLAERNMFEDRDANLRLKLFTYRKISQMIRQRYPDSKLLLATWDFALYWKNEEVQKLVKELDPERTIIFDYTSDMDDPENSYINWGVIGKFPWIFGLFHAYESESSLRGPYDRYDERLKIAADDPMCKGMVMWPELSHTDPLILEYLAENSWNPLSSDIEEIVHKISATRYGDMGKEMDEIWTTVLPFVKLVDWGGYSPKKDDDPESEKYVWGDAAQKELWHRYILFNKPNNKRYISYYRYHLNKFKDALQNAENTMEMLSGLDGTKLNTKFINRDIVDIARMIVGRYMHMLIAKAQILNSENRCSEIVPLKEIFAKLMDCLADILMLNKDFSLYHSMLQLDEVCPINKNFEKALKKSPTICYCSQYVYETVKYLYSKECSLAFDELINNDGTDHKEEYDQMLQHFMDTPLEDMQPDFSADISETLNKASRLIHEAKRYL